MFKTFKNHPKLKITVIIIMLIVYLSTTSIVWCNEIQRKEPFTEHQLESEISEEDGPNKKPFVEYFFDHRISEKDAKQTFRNLENKLLNETNPAYCSIHPCNKNVLKYCLSKDMLHDHCCCDFKHSKDALSWLPHSCYVSQSCRPSIGSCITYTEVRECCCQYALAMQWKDTYSSACQISSNYYILIVCLLLYKYKNIFF